jgi:tetratricopeptide (TPR) repeat protein
MPVEPHAQASAMAAATLSAMEADQYRKRFAGRVSTELLRDSRAPLAAPPPPVENPAGWKNIEEELRLRLTRCDEFLRRNAVLSARDEALAGLRLLIRNVDLRTGTSTGEPSLDRALRAFEEESDFHESIRNPAHGASTKAIVARHTTPILKQVDLETVSPELAAQHYRNFARFELYQATQNHPWAADLLYAFGKTIERRSATQGDDAGQWRNQAVVCYEVALTIAPNHPGSANQLGHVLLKLDRVDEAYAALYQSIQSRPSPEAWQSIAEIYRRRGYAAQADEAVRQATAIRSSTSNVPEVISLDPQTFIGISPNHFVGPTTAVAAGPVASPSTSAEKKSWFGKWWR